jgi:antirestriction protein
MNSWDLYQKALPVLSKQDQLLLCLLLYSFRNMIKQQRCSDWSEMFFISRLFRYRMQYSCSEKKPWNWRKKLWSCGLKTALADWGENNYKETYLIKLLNITVKVVNFNCHDFYTPCTSVQSDNDLHLIRAFYPYITEVCIRPFPNPKI